MRRQGAGPATWMLALAGGAALVWALVAPGEKTVLTDDERDYAQAAIHLARHGVFSHSAAIGASAPDALREPGYSAFLAAVWTIAGSEVPLRPEELTAGIARARGAVRPVQRSQRLLLVLAALGAAAATVRLGGRAGAAVAAFVLVVGSPALARNTDLFASEALAAPLLIAVCLSLACAVARPAVGAVLGGGLLLGLLTLVRAGFAAVAPLLALGLLLLPAGGGGRPRVPRFGLATLYLLAALLPLGLWMARNRATLGAFAMDDRVVLAARVELGADIESEGPSAAVRAWTPWPLPGDEVGTPPNRFERWSWRPGSAESGFFARAMHRRQELLTRLGDPLAASRVQRREAQAAIVARPARYLRATLPVAWRSLFAERSPRLFHPFDLALPINLALAVAFLMALAHAATGNDRASLALLLPVIAIYIFSCLATEGLPRFQQPSLPILWAAAATTVDRLVARSGRRTVSKDKTSG